MSRNGSGTYSLPSNSWNPATNGTPATAADWQTLINDVAAALTQSLSKDGQTPLTGNLAAGGNKVTGLAAATANGDAVRFEQLPSASNLLPVASGGTGSATAADARTALGAAASGANTDITSLTAHPVGKMIAQVQTFQSGTVATGTTVIPSDNTIPQSTEGDQYMSLSITPQNAASTLEIDVTINLGNSANVAQIAALFQDSTANALAASWTQLTAGQIGSIVFKHVMTAGTTSATTFKVRSGGGTAGTTTFNGGGGTQFFGGVMSSRITIKEILP